jgi:glycyl-tRNA synthetase
MLKSEAGQYGWPFWSHKSTILLLKHLTSLSYNPFSLTSKLPINQQLRSHMPDSQSLSFQDVILKLQSFWAEQGCVIWQPYNIQLGAGTGNPATLLRVLGPEPWNVAYVEPSIRPDDGRFGENPNRMQMFYQYQVILKPDPGNPQELYLRSLQALGIDPRQHDIRFVEDNWESPALGAWGLGWEVWLDGQEITQFTYFQQAGGLNLEPVSVEITYGLERIALALQGVDAVWDMDFTQGISYGDIYLQSEIEHCRYYFEIADVEGLKTVYDVYEDEHRRALENDALMPAYDYVLKCSHLFNVLDTRGAIGVTERAYYFRRMRDMTRNIARAFAEQRQQLEYPLLDINDSEQHAAAIDPSATLPVVPLIEDDTPRDLLLEIGTEELPYADVDAALVQLWENVPVLMDELRLEHNGVEVYGTPRRLVVLVKELATHQQSVINEFRGPPANRAFDEEGNPTKAAEGFARSKGISPDDLTRKEIDGGEYVVAEVEDKGQPAADILSEALASLIEGLKFVKTMRWNETGVAFSRPVRWLVALFGEDALPVYYAGLTANRITRGTRPLGSPLIELNNASQYFHAMQQQGIILDSAERQSKIEERAMALAEEVGGRLASTPGLLQEVTNLVEQPTVFRGSFDEKYLALPREVLIMVMKKHQRYFAVENAQGELLPYFIAVRNGDDEYLDKVIKGNEHVLVARFSDAEFFYHADIKQPLESYLPRLGTLTFQEKLGSMLDKNNRVRDMVPAFAELVGAAEDVVPVAQRAAALAKADLGTQMVVEMTALQGTMGRIYAEHAGEDPDVANAIFQHWRPASADDALPSGAPGILLALLDRLDSLVSLFAVDLIPTSSADPFALRRAALGIIQILFDQGLGLDLREAIDLVAEHQPVPVPDESKGQLIDFIVGRLRSWLHENTDYPYEVIEAVLVEQGYNPVRALHGIEELQKWTQVEEWEEILDSFARCARIIRDQPDYELHPDRFVDDAEKELFQAYFTASHRLHPLTDNVDRFLANFVPMIPAVTRFFDDIMVMDEDEKVRHNRLSLLQHVVALADGRADLSKLPGF